jgi:hypothetical protein
VSLPLVGRYFDSPLSQVTPFTYRDGETFLEQLKRLRCWVDNVTAALESNIEQVAADDKTANNALADELNGLLTAFTNKWESELLALEDEAKNVTRDPTTGSLSPIGVVVNHVYDNTRYYAYFANQLDAFDYTAAEWDAIGYTARHFDLVLGYSPATTQALDTVPSTVTPS